MSVIALALLLPSIFWTGGPQSAAELKRDGIEKIVVPSNMLTAWKGQSAIEVSAANPADFERLAAPGISFHSQVASATREPWVNSNGWHYLRQPSGHFLYDAPGQSAMLAAAEAFSFGGQALIQTDEAGLAGLARMLTFLAGIPDEKMRPVVNIDFVDDGSSVSAECMNLLIRRNLLVEARHSELQEQKLQLVVLGSADYPKKDAANPVVFAQQVREHLTDEKRSLRIYGSNVVIGRMASNGRKTRVFLLNYGAGKYSIEGLRVRVLGHHSQVRLLDPELLGNKLTDTLYSKDATEATIQRLKTFAIIDLEE